MTREEELFSAALALPATDRPVFLAHACAQDGDLYRRLMELLDAFEASEKFFTAPLLPPPPTPVEEKAGDVIDRYLLVRPLGQGGCGTVYLAEQRTPVRRLVALKVIKLGMDTREVVARFEVERQLLALMDHPNIARVYDAGATATGRPYFVMELVDGVPVTQFCDKHQLSVADRLELVTRICAALQHAHQKGVIHRDLKPSNILVALQDGKPSPKIIDFGIAKATQGQLAGHTLITQLEQMLGTPAYMSPEQADQREADIDTRSDIYALGVLLYELLAGRPPFDPKTLVQAGAEEVRRIIREIDPPRPSTILSTLAAEDRTTIAQHRAAGPERLTSVLRGDLDWIVMRCLEKDRDRRYGTASELAQDLRRHLQREPVTARPPSALYRTRKFISRHRLACAAVAGVALALVAGTGISTWQAIRATRAEHAAQLAQADARRRQAEAESLLAFMLGDFRAELKKIGRLSLLDAVGDRAMAYFQRADPRDLTDSALAQQAKALTQIGENRLDQARLAEASQAFETAYARAAALAARHPANADLLFERAQAEYWIGFAARRRGDFATTREWFARYRATATALVQLEGPTPRALGELAYGHRNLAVGAFDQGDLAAARTEFLAERAVLDDLARQQPSDPALRGRRAEVSSWLGSVAERGGDLAAAAAAFAEQTTLLSELVRDEPARAYWRDRLAEALAFSGDLQLATGRLDAAAQLYTRAAALADELVAMDATNRRWQHAQLKFRLKLVETELHRGAGAAPLAQVAEIRRALAELVQAEPRAVTYAASLAKAWRLEATLLFLHHAPAATAAVEQALALHAPVIQSGRADLAARAEFANACVLAARLALTRAQPELAQGHAERGLHALSAALPASHDWRTLAPAALACALLGRTTEEQAIAARLRDIGYALPDPLGYPARKSAPSTVPEK